MIKIFIAALCCVLAFSLTSCAKKGCTDPTSNNFDADATKDDGSCTFDAANKYVGTYLATDTIIAGQWNGSGMTYVTSYSQPGLIITKKDANAIRIINFANCSDTLDATVSTSSLILTSSFSNFCFEATGKVISVNGNNLRYMISYNANGGSSVDTIKGVAIKQ